MEYAVVLVVGTIAGMAVWLLSAWVEAKLYAEILNLIDWIKDGGFRRAIGR